MTTQITIPTDDDAYPEPTDRSSCDYAPLLFSPTSHAAAGQFDTEAEQSPR
jgi:hypothetical protein